MRPTRVSDVLEELFLGILCSLAQGARHLCPISCQRGYKAHAHNPRCLRACRFFFWSLGDQLWRRLWYSNGLDRISLRRQAHFGDGSREAHSIHSPLSVSSFLSISNLWCGFASSSPRCLLEQCEQSNSMASLTFMNYPWEPTWSLMHKATSHSVSRHLNTSRRNQTIARNRSTYRNVGLPSTKISDLIARSF